MLAAAAGHDDCRRPCDLRMAPRCRVVPAVEYARMPAHAGGGGCLSRPAWSEARRGAAAVPRRRSSWSGCRSSSRAGTGSWSAASGPKDFEVLEDGRPQPIVVLRRRRAGRGPAAAPRPAARHAARAWSRTCATAANAAVPVRQGARRGRGRHASWTSTRRSASGRFTPASYPRLFERIRERKADGRARRSTTRSACIVERTLGRDRPARRCCCTPTAATSTSRMTFGKLQRAAAARQRDRLRRRLPGEPAESASGMTQQLRLSADRARDRRRGVLPARRSDELHAGLRADPRRAARRATRSATSRPNPKTDGRFRKVEVKLTRPRSRAPRSARAPGYLAPTAPAGRRLADFGPT